MKQKIIYIIVTLCRFILSFTFLFSGIVKAIDPIGMSEKVNAYLGVFHHAQADDSVLLMFSVFALAAAEFLLGINLFLGIHRRKTIGFSLFLLTGFTFITIYLYITNDVEDCGCFGEALVLNNSQTLLKNIGLLCCNVVLAFYPAKIFRFITARNQWITVLFSFVYILTLTFVSYYFYPPIDFGQYKEGFNLYSALEGKYGEAAQEHLADFALWDEAEDKTLDVLTDTSNVFLLMMPQVKYADAGICDRINDLSDYCEDKDYRFYGVTASSAEDIEKWIDLTGAAYPFLESEEHILREFAGTNPTLVQIRGGQVIHKWGKNELPEETHFDTVFEEITAEKTSNTIGEWLKLLLWFIIPLIFIIFADGIWVRTKFYKRRFSKKSDKNIQSSIKLINSIMRKKIVAGNWKMNKNLQDGVALAKELNEMLVADKPNCDVVICTPFIHLASVAQLLNPEVLGLGAENCADKVSGAYTGEVSAEMVKSTGAQYVILGHSERRAYYGETAEILKEKVNLALANGLKVIFCIGEVLEEREAGKQNEVVKAQLEGSLFDLSNEEFANIILAYEPVWAIGTGKTATAEQAEDMHAFIRNVIAEKFGAAAADETSILYGGSCKPSNAKEIFAKPNVDGGLIGGAALKAADFKGIIDAWK